MIEWILTAFHSMFFNGGLFISKIQVLPTWCILAKWVQQTIVLLVAARFYPFVTTLHFRTVTHQQGINKEHTHATGSMGDDL